MRRKLLNTLYFIPTWNNEKNLIYKSEILFRLNHTLIDSYKKLVVGL